MKRLLSMLSMISGETSRDLVLKVLSQEWPLTIRKLHSKIESQRSGISYHAVHKAVNQLAQQGALKREGGKYLINITWIEEIGSLIENIRSNYASNRPLYLPSLRDFRQQGDSKVLIFENLAKADEYRRRIKLEYIRSGQRKPYISMSRHMRLPLLYSESSITFTSEAIRNGILCYFLSSESTPPDEWCADQYRMQQQFVKTSVKLDQNCDVAVMGDIVTQLYIPERIGRAFDRIYNSVRDVSEINIPELHRQICLAPAETRYVIMFNPEIAEQLRQYVLNHFRRNSVAFFDIDGTFIDLKFQADATIYLQRSGILNQPAGKELEKLCEDFKSGRITHDEFSLNYMQFYGSSVKGKSSSEIESSVHKFLKSEGFKHIHRNTLKLFYLIKSYKKTIAISRQPLEFIEALRPLFIFDDIVSTRMSLTRGVFDGSVEQNLSIPGEIENAIKEISSTGTIGHYGIYNTGSISFIKSLGLGSRYFDISFLKRVKNQFVVNPEKKLKTAAKKRNWPVFSDSLDDLLTQIKEILKAG